MPVTNLFTRHTLTNSGSTAVALASTSPDVGAGTWALVSGAPDLKVQPFSAGTAYNDPDILSAHQYSVTVPTADVRAVVTATANAPSASLGRSLQFNLREQVGDACYFVVLAAGSPGVLYYWSGSAATTLDTQVSNCWEVGDTATWEMTVEGTSVSVKKNGTAVLSATDATLAAAGKVRVQQRNLTIDLIEVYDASASGPTLSAPTVVSTGNTIATVRVTTDTPPTVSSILAVRTRPAGDPAWTAAEVLASPTATITSGASGARDFNLTGLTNGTALAADFAQTGSNVVSTASFTPSTVPGAPTIGTATAGNAQATVAGTAPASNGGSAITGYRSTATPGGSTVTGASLPITHTGLTNGTAYTFTLAAQNANGYGAESAASNSVTPSAGGDTTAPSITSTGTGGTNGPFTATVAENSTATFITFTSDEALASVTKAGANDGSYTLAGSGLTRTLARTTGFDYEAWVLAGSVPEVVTLAFADAAANVRNVTVNISPTNVNEAPSAPTIGTATAGDQTVSIAFTAPVNTGKPTITGYTATLSPGGITKTGASSPIVFGAGDGVVNDTAYTGVVKATNSEGTGPDSSSSNSVTPTAGAPTGATINSEPLGNNNNVLLPNTLLLWVGVRDFLTGTPVALHTNITTDSSAQFSLYDAALNVADRYLVDWVTESFEHGRAEAVGE